MVIVAVAAILSVWIGGGSLVALWIHELGALAGPGSAARLGAIG